MDVTVMMLIDPLPLRHTMTLALIFCFLTVFMPSFALLVLGVTRLADEPKARLMQD
jgi:hypothetical protein